MSAGGGGGGREKERVCVCVCENGEIRFTNSMLDVGCSMLDVCRVMQTSVFPWFSFTPTALATCGRRLALRLALVAGLLTPLAGCASSTSAPPEAPAAPRKSVKLLTIGNSFSNDAIGQLPDMAKAGGKELILGRASLGGCSLERHAKHLAAALSDPDSKDARPYSYSAVFGKALADKKTVSLPEALAAQEWDFVTIQEWSARSFKPEYQEPYARQLIEAIRKYAPTAEILVHHTWAYREDHPWYQKGGELTQKKMYDGLHAAYIDLANRYGLRIIPSGVAIQAARQTPRWTYKPDANFDFKNAVEGQLPDQTGSLNVGWRWAKPKDGTAKKLNLDAIHANTAGRYLGACAFYETIYNDATPPATAFAPKGLSVEDAAGLREIAHDAVQTERQRERVQK